MVSIIFTKSYLVQAELKVAYCYKPVSYTHLDVYKRQVYN